MKRVFATSGLLVVFVATPSTASQPPVVRNCTKLFTIQMGHRAGRAVYRGHRHVTMADYRLLGYIERCQVNPDDQAQVRRFDRHQRMLHDARVRRWRLEQSMQYAVASWYDDAGATASGFHAGYGVANKSLPFGTHVLICFPVHSHRCVMSVVDDRGPYVGGREFDLNQNVAGALGFDGVATVGYHIGG